MGIIYKGISLESSLATIPKITDTIYSSAQKNKIIIIIIIKL